MKHPFPSHYTDRKTLLNMVSGILLYLVIVGNLNLFQKVTLPNVHLVPAAQDHAPLYFHIYTKFL